MIHTWQKKALYEIAAEITSGGAAPQGEPFFENGTFPFVRVADMGKLGMNKYMVDTKDKLNNTGISKLRLFPKGTVLFTKSGASLLLNQRAILNKSMYVVSHIGCIIPSEQVLSEWLYYWMLQIDFAKYAHATTLPSLKLTTLKELKVPVPPLEEQARIVARIEELFSQLESGVETLKQTKEQLAVYRQAVLKEAFAHIEKKAPIRDLTTLVTSGSRGWAQYYSDRGALFIRIGNLTRTGIEINFDDIQNVFLPDRAEGLRSRLQPNDVLISITADLGSIGLVPETIPEAYINQHIAVVRFQNSNQGKFMAYYLRSDWGQKDLLKNKRGAGKMGLGLDDIRDTPVPVVSDDEAAEVLAEIESRLSVCDKIEQTVDTALQQAEALRQSILKKAFEGGL